MKGQQEDRLQNQYQPQPGTRRDPGGTSGVAVWKRGIFLTMVLELGFSLNEN